MLLILNTNDDNSFMTTQTAFVTFNEKVKTSILDINFEDANYALFKFFWASEKLLPEKQCKIPSELSGIMKLLKILYAQ